MTKEIKTLQLDKVEKNLGYKLLRNTKVLGLDTASKTGYAILTTNGKTLKINVGFIDVKSSDIYYKYDEIIKYFRKLIDNSYNSIIVEDTFYSFNAWTFKMLTRIGSFAYVIAKENECKDIRLITASHARKEIGLKGNAKKPELVLEINRILELEIKTNDITDAIILALNGLIDKGK